MREEQINLDLRTHQRNIEDWDKRVLAEDLYTWAERFIGEFRLNAAVPALMLDRLSHTCRGHFRLGRNGFGLLNEIAINEIYITREEYWRILATLLHELLHAEQENNRAPEDARKYRGNNHHDKIYRSRAATFGLIIDRWGHTQVCPAPSLFWALLEKHGIAVPNIPAPVEVRAAMPGNSKLKLWVCQCPEPVHVRVAIKDFQARCLKCGHVFVRSDGTRQPGGSHHDGGKHTEDR
jgi:hypothetical protein